MNFGFIVIAPKGEIKHIVSTIKSIKYNYPDIDCICVTNKRSYKAKLEDLCSVFITTKCSEMDMINFGMQKGHKEWNIVIRENTIVKRNLCEKYEMFINNEKDILFPILVNRDKDRKPFQIFRKFIDLPTMNGLFIHRDTFNKIGDFNGSKMNWACNAVGEGCTFKAILGVKLN